MKTNSMQVPDRLQDLGNGHFYINFGVKERNEKRDDGTEVTSFDYESVEVDHFPDDHEIKEALISEGFPLNVAETVIENDNVTLISDLLTNGEL